VPIKADDVKLNAVITALFKGETKTGKTIAACGKEFWPVYVMDFENRMSSVIHYYRQLYPGEHLDIEYDTYNMDTGYMEIDKRMDQLAARCEYKTVVASTLTSYVYCILSHLIKTKFGQKTKSGAPAGMHVGGIPVNELQDYNAEDAAIMFDLIKFMKILQAQGVNTILEAHVVPYEEKNKVTETYNIARPIVTKGRKPPAVVPIFFSEIYHFYTESEGMNVGSSKRSNKYKFTTEATSIDSAGTGLGITGFDWTNLDFSVELMKQLSPEIKDNPRRDPNAPNLVKF
jgi:hypothetical protein